MNHLVIKCLARLRLIHGGPIEVMAYNWKDGDVDISVEATCLKCNCAMELSDMDVRPDLDSVIYDLGSFEV